jgi:hypothetical protein
MSRILRRLSLRNLKESEVVAKPAQPPSTKEAKKEKKKRRSEEKKELKRKEKEIKLKAKEEAKASKGKKKTSAPLAQNEEERGGGGAPNNLSSHDQSLAIGCYRVEPPLTIDSLEPESIPLGSEKPHEVHSSACL